MLTVLAVVLGLVIGVLSGGRLARLTGVDVHHTPLAVAGFVLPMIATRLDPPAPEAWVAIGLLCVAAFAASNLHLVGMGVVLVGVLCNLAPIVVNGHFPVDPDAVIAAGLATEASIGTIELSGGRALAEADDHLRFLGDVIPVPVSGQVLSFGDLIILVGLVDVAAHLVMRRRRRRIHPRGSSAVLRSINTAKPVHDWGAAPPPTPVSGFQYSASDEARAPAMVDSANEAALAGRS